MRLLFLASAAMLLGNSPIAGVASAAATTPPPPPLDYPRRPPPLALGEGIEGDFGSPCFDDVDADGSFYHDIRRPLTAGQSFWFGLSSPDFEPTLTVFKAGDEARPVAELRGAANGRRSGLLFKVIESGDYIIRTSAPAGRKGRWFTEIVYDGKRENAFPEKIWSGPVKAACGG